MGLNTVITLLHKMLGHSADITSSPLRLKIKESILLDIYCKHKYKLISRLINAVSHVTRIYFIFSRSEVAMTVIHAVKAHTSKPFTLKFRRSSYAENPMAIFADTAVINELASVELLNNTKRIVKCFCQTKREKLISRNPLLNDLKKV